MGAGNGKVWGAPREETGAPRGNSHLDFYFQLICTLFPQLLQQNDFFFHFLNMKGGSVTQNESEEILKCSSDE